MALSKTNTAVVLLVGFVNYLEWAVVMTSIYPYIVSASILIILYNVFFRSFLRNHAELEVVVRSTKTNFFTRLYFLNDHGKCVKFCIKRKISGYYRFRSAE